MRLSCPECGEPIAADNINVNDLIAVCTVCDTVFRFDIPDDKPKRRKVKAPPRLQVDEGSNSVALSYQRVFGAETRGAAIGLSIGTAMLSIVALTTLGGFLASDVPFFVPLILGGFFLFALYTWLTIFVNRTHLLIDDSHVQTKYTPFHHPLEDKAVAVDRAAIAGITLEETHASKQAQSVEPDYIIWADLHDSSRVMLLKGVPEAYALYIQQQLEAYYLEESDNEHQRLEAVSAVEDDEQLALLEEQSTNSQVPS